MPADDATQAPSSPSPAEAADHDLDALVDRGTWESFSQGLAALLSSRRPVAGNGDGDGLLLLLTAPAPVLEPRPARRSPLERFLNRHEPEPSPEVPGLVITATAQGARIDLPALDAQGRGLLGREHRDLLAQLGWEPSADVMTRLIQDEAQAARDVVRVLIEVLGVAHPADLDTLLDPGA